MAAIVALDGEIDLHRSAMVREQLEPHIAANESKLVVDLSDVTYIDSSGLAIFIEAMQRVQGYGGKFVLCGLRESVRHIFAIACLDQVFTIAPDQAAALAG